MKTFKRNAVIIAVLMFVAVAAYLNWSYSGKNGDGSLETDSTAEAPEALSSDGASSETDAAESDDTNGAGLYYADDNGEGTAMSGYFDEMRLNRSQARDEAMATLVEASEIEGASQETVDAAVQKITQMAEWTAMESELETLICSKGFSECVVYVSETGVTVTVEPQTAEGLSTAAVARITDIVTEKTGFTAQELNIVEIK